MNFSRIIPFLLLAGVAGPVGAAPDLVIYERAPVLRVVPVYNQVLAPVRECHTAYESADSADAGARTGRTVLGAVIGGLAGSAVGKGDGRVAAAAVGAATGAVIGNNWEDRSSPTQVEQCVTVDRYHRELVGYDVTYDFQGRTATTRMSDDPGAWVDVTIKVGVQPQSPGPSKSW